MQNQQMHLHGNPESEKVLDILKRLRNEGFEVELCQHSSEEPILVSEGRQQINGFREIEEVFFSKLTQ